MAVGHIYKTNHTTQISIRKINAKTALNRAKIHNERIGNEKGKHIDDSRYFLNETLINSVQNYFLEIVSKVTNKNVTADEIDKLSKNNLRYADGSKVRKDAVLAFEAETKYPGDLIWSRISEKGEVEPVPEDEIVDSETVKAKENGGKGYFLYPADEKEFNEWKQATIDFLKARFGADNVLSAELHMDEFDPHIHAVIVPAYEDEKGVTKLSYARYINGPADMGRLQSEYAESLSHLGYERGAIGSARLDYGDMNSVKVMLAEALPAQLPEDKDEAEKAYKAAMVQATLSKSFEARTRVNSTLRRQNKIIENKSKENEELKNKICDLTEQLEYLKYLARRYECEKKGLEECKDRDLVENIYKPFQDKMILAGMEAFGNMGIDMSLDSASEIEQTPDTINELGEIGK